MMGKTKIFIKRLPCEVVCFGFKPCQRVER